MKSVKFISLIFSLFFIVSVSAKQVDMQNPNTVLHAVSENALSRIAANKEKLKTEPAYIKVIINEELIPYFDYKYAAYKVVGKNLKKTSKVQRSEFVTVFKEYIINVYGHILLEFDGQEVSIHDNKNFQNKKTISVPVNLKDKNDQRTNLVFKLRKNKKTGAWKVFDVIAEGVSMLNTKQSEIGGLIDKKGIDEVIKMLKEKNAEQTS
jgi:phospholipid transport system substrate-binding protein